MSEMDEGIVGVSLPFSGVRDNIADLAQRTLNNVSELVSEHPTPTFATIVGASAVLGSILEYRALNRDNRNRYSVVDVWGAITDEMPVSRTKKAAKALTSLATFGAGTLAALNASLWINFQEPNVVPPKMGVVVDKSGSTLFDENNSANTISIIVSSFDSGLQDFDTSAWVASLSTVDQLTLDEAKAVEPFGDAPLGQAFSLSLDSSIEARTVLEPGEEIPSTAIAVITNGNDVNGRLSDQKIENAGTPVYVFDVSGGTADSEDLQALSTETGGEYFGLEQLDTPEEVESAIEVIKKEVEVGEEKGSNNANNILRYSVLAASALTALKWRRVRAKQPSLIEVAAEEKLRTKIFNNTIGRLPVIGKRVRR